MSDKPTLISKKPLREEIHALLRERIVAGRVLPGSRLQDVQLAEELGVSRTPIREALLRLVREGLVENDPHRGFFVAPLSRQEVLETYPIVWTLECLAQESCGPPTPQQIQALRQINAELAAVTDDPLRRHELDLHWHATLVEPCGNQRLKDLIAGLEQIIHRYECVYMLDPSLVRGSVRDHTEIIKALGDNKPEVARRLLQQHWRNGMASLLDRLDESEQNTVG
jgi:DNA-binding GntR family transcriptional regulator